MSARDDQLPTGYRIRIRCDATDCFVGDVEVTSRGGSPIGSPICPGCQTVMKPGEVVIPPLTWRDLE